MTASQNKRNKNVTPFAFTEHGVTMLASVLKSKKAIKMNITIVEAFIALKQFVLSYKKLAQKIASLEKKHNRKFTDIYEALNLLLNENKVKENWQKRNRIRFKK